MAMYKAVERLSKTASELHKSGKRSRSIHSIPDPIQKRRRIQLCEMFLKTFSLLSSILIASGIIQTISSKFFEKNLTINFYE